MFCSSLVGFERCAKRTILLEFHMHGVPNYQGCVCEEILKVGTVE